MVSCSPRLQLPVDATYSALERGLAETELETMWVGWGRIISSLPATRSSAPALNSLNESKLLVGRFRWFWLQWKSCQSYQSCQKEQFLRYMSCQYKSENILLVRDISQHHLDSGRLSPIPLSWIPVFEVKTSYLDKPPLPVTPASHNTMALQSISKW